MTTVAIVQARMGSSRLPGKSLMILNGQPVLHRVLHRLGNCRFLDRIIVATTLLGEDDQIEALAGNDFAVYRGSTGDVLDRYYQAAVITKADVIVRITADCPLIDPGLVDQAISTRLRHDADFCSNTLLRTFPKGLDVEVMTRPVLEHLWRTAHEARYREHVTLAIYEDPGKYRTAVLRADADYSRLRWTLDTPADFEMLQSVFRHLAGREDFGWREVLALVHQHPEIARLNSEFTVSSSFTSFDDQCLA